MVIGANSHEQTTTIQSLPNGQNQVPPYVFSRSRSRFTGIHITIRKKDNFMLTLVLFMQKEKKILSICLSFCLSVYPSGYHLFLVSVVIILLTTLKYVKKLICMKMKAQLRPVSSTDTPSGQTKNGHLFQGMGEK